MQALSQQPSPEAAQAVAEGILQDGAYSEVGADGSGFLAYTEETFNLFRRLQDWLDDLNADSPFLYWSLFATLVLILCLLILHIVWSFRQAFRPSNPNEGVGSDLGPTAEDRVRRSIGIAVEDGRLTDALSLQFRLALILRNRTRPGRLRPGMTNRESLIAWEDQPSLRTQLAQVVDLLDCRWYACRECGEEEYARASQMIVESHQ